MERNEQRGDGREWGRKSPVVNVRRSERCLCERGGVLVSSLGDDGEVVEGLVEALKCWPLLGHLPPTLEHQLVG